MATSAVYAWYPVDGSAQKQGWVALSAAPLKSNTELAEISGVGERTIRQAKAVQQQASPEVVEAVKRGVPRASQRREPVRTECGVRQQQAACREDRLRRSFSGAVPQRMMGLGLTTPCRQDTSGPHPLTHRPGRVPGFLRLVLALVGAYNLPTDPRIWASCLQIAYSVTANDKGPRHFRV